ncbi:MAG: peptide deformylase [Bryobacteraceae bacterium]|nr:peptide deformylase [Solibacteraceae bacterium]MCL4842284.1 peptide deformylase [Bryobacteraceae bacterium]MCO5350960.1 peptide deformylase [Bryobacteraceae bacterium]
MPARPILLLGHPLLRERSEPVPEPPSARLLLRDLRATLLEFRRTHGFGRGISAVQIGETRRVIYLEVEGQEYELVNPEYTWLSGDKFELWDDCFSFPDLMVRLERHRRVVLRYQRVTGEYRVLEAEGALAELVQHEMDHLDGVLAVDHARSSRDLAMRAVILQR